MTILLTPFMSCSAKLPIYGSSPPSSSGAARMWGDGGLYLFGIVLGVLHATLLRKTLFFRRAGSLFVMELPNYRMPGAKNVCQLLWEKSRFPPARLHRHLCRNDRHLVPANVRSAPQRRRGFQGQPAGADGRLALPLFKPLGFGDWRICTALLTGFPWP